ncbi:MAG TPA: RHS repeat-associated core domain-containing protein, partial [Gemmatimonadales bacterium]|nr:RHS repeat-associated core domain-containing protein [Gemmatimonadales bacterium]
TDTTIVVYDSTFRRRPVQARLPLVQAPDGTWQKPAIGYLAREYQGIGTLRALDSAYVQMTDPRGFWTRSLLDRWGQASRTWDALGLQARTSYLPDGRVVWTEGAVPDSSRVWTTYDALRQVVRTRWVRAVGDTVRLDSLVYDANYRVIRSIDPRNQVTTVTYDGEGHPVMTVGPAQTTTVVGYLANGQVDSTWTSESGAVHYTYDLTWQNRSSATGPYQQLLQRSYFDGSGRDTLTESSLRVQATGTTPQMQWRKARTWYTVANEVDSTVLYRGDNCNVPCYSYPATFDSLHRQAVGWRRDRAGRDTARVDTRGKATTYRLDRLGRVVAHRPWADSAIVRDSLVYDLAGNVVTTMTRRGYVLTSQYDSRNRDTLIVIPTVGTLRKQYGGPAGQLTRQWLTGAVDSIGGVNGEVRWAYDQRGRLVADTAYSGSVARAQSYTYDPYERPSTRTDAVGLWSTRYETARGLPDTLLTPFGDTLRLTLDLQARPTSQWVAGAGGAPLQLTARSWNLSGALDATTHTVDVFGAAWEVMGVARPDAPDSAGPSLAPFGLLRDGPLAVPDSVQDSVAYDGWQRVVSWRRERSAGGGSVVTRAYSFDPMGNLFQSGGELYNGMTNQLRKGAGGFLTYDNAGNLTARSQSGLTYGYDALHRLVSVRQNGVLIARYGYDVLGRRIVKRVYSGATGGTVGYLRMGYAGSQVAFETDSANTTLSTIYIWGPGVDNLLAVRVAGTSYTVVTDALGSVRAVLRQADGVWQGRLAYDPYGQLLDSAGTLPAGRYRWTGREYDAETGFYFHRSRYYDPAVGRFVQEDPVGDAGGPNPYAYVGGNVLQARDPFGAMSDYPPYSWAGLCIADFCFDQYGGFGGGGGASQRFTSLISWAAASSWLYDLYGTYMHNYGKMVQAMAASPQDYPSYMRAMYFGSSPLSRVQFQDILGTLMNEMRFDRSTSALPFGDVLHSGQVAAGFIDRLVGGQVIVNEEFIELYAPASTVALTAYGVTIIHPTRFFSPRWEDFRGNFLLHEQLHHQYLPDGTSGYHCMIYRAASDLSGRRYVPQECVS